MSTNLLCSYCCKSVDPAKLCLSCSVCKRYIHIKCLKNYSGLAGVLLDDVFFTLICENCSNDHKEILSRDKLSWLALVVLVLYNLHQQSATSSRKGYFHWKIHICKFIHDKWKILFAPNIKRKRTWMGTVSGTLTHAPGTFQSGLEDLGEAGWWRLCRPNVLPQQTLTMMKSQSNRKPPKIHSEIVIKTEEEASTCSGTEFVTDSNPQCSSTGHELSWSVSSDSNEMYSKAYVEPSATLSDVLFDVEQEDVDLEVDTMNMPVFSPLTSTTNIPPDPVQLVNSVDISPYAQSWIKQEKNSDTPLWPPNQNEQENLFDIPETNVNARVIQLKHEKDDVSDDTETSTRVESRVEACSDDEGPKTMPCQPMSQFEEIQLMHRLQRAGNLPNPAARRLLRKLAVRHAKRQHNMPLFNLDLSPKGYTKKDPSLSKHLNYGFERVLDRFQTECHFRNIRDKQQQLQSSFLLRLIGQSVPTCFYSPYTERLLKPYILRESSAKAPWVQLMRELQARMHRNEPDWEQPHLTTLDYSYVRPQHIASINSLCRLFFWPGIDISESLQYPDFSCVALYKKLIVGFAFLVPNASYNESYISFLFVRPEWRRAGIASFMLYHLIQTCMGKDVTLHVSATNPALILYQKFGFKVEEFVQDFYEKYLEVDSKECRHALFLRLSR